MNDDADSVILYNLSSRYSKKLVFNAFSVALTNHYATGGISTLGRTGSRINGCLTESEINVSTNIIAFDTIDNAAVVATVWFATKKISAGQELFISYGDSYKKWLV